MKNSNFILSLVFAIVAMTVNAQNFEWTEQSSGVTETLRDVYFADSNVGWVVGDDGLILYTNDGGVNWTSQTSGVTDRVRAVYALDSQTAYVVGGESSKIMLKTEDAGDTWQSFDPNNEINHNQILGVHFWSSSIGWVITNDNIFYTNDGGESWVNEEYTNNITQVQNRAITATSDTTAFVASRRKRSGTLNPYADVFYRFISNNYPWVESSTTQFNSDDGGLYAIEFADYNTGFAGGSMGILYKSDDLDPSDLSGPWNVNLDLSASIPSLIYSICFPSSTNGMFCIGYSPGGVNNTLVYHTSDTGDSWSAEPDTIAGLFTAKLHAPDVSNAWAVGSFGKIFNGVAIPLGIGEYGLDLEIDIYPNPTTDFVNLEFKSESLPLFNYSVLDISGKKIDAGQLSVSSNNSKLKIDFSDFDDGIYLLKISADKGHNTYRILKQ